MAQKCDLCGKGPQFGNNISHAHNKAQVNGASKRMRVCTSCIKTGKVIKG
jgi:large subunit ribosomal protein L28